jgi:hypothetical protein
LEGNGFFNVPHSIKEEDSFLYMFCGGQQESISGFACHDSNDFCRHEDIKYTLQIKVKCSYLS